MATSDIHSALPTTCKITIPSKDAELHDVVSRWSDALVSLPYAVVVPASSSDIESTIAFAGANNLSVIPASGGHGTFVPINGRTIYLDMQNFKTINLDEANETVTIGGGCVTKEVLSNLTAKGWYTALPNSNAVGVVGALLGGLSHTTNGKHGFGLDHVASISIIPFSTPSGGDPKTLTLTPESTGEEGKLFDVLCGAGHGMGVVTSLTLRAWKLEQLGMTDNKIWTRRLMFPAPHIQTAAETYLSLLPPSPEFTVVLVFIRAPPTAPVPGAPLVMLSLSCLGPADLAEKAAAKTFEENVLAKTISAVTAPTDFATMNDGFDAMNVHGGFKEYHSCFCKDVDAASIVNAFQAWKEFTDAPEKGFGRSYLVIASWSVEALQQNASRAGGKARFFSERDRGVFVQATPWYTKAEGKGEADAFGKSTVAAIRAQDVKAGRENKAFANNLIAGQDMREVYTKEQIEEIKSTKALWDGKGVGWSPAVEGWS